MICFIADKKTGGNKMRGIYKPLILFVVSTIVWVGAITLKTFGEPLWQWHLINSIIVAIAIGWFIAILAAGEPINEDEVKEVRI